MNLSEISELFDYTEWANRLTLDAVEALPAGLWGEDARISHGSILGTLSHIAGAEKIWLSRWLGETQPRIWETDKFEDPASLRREWLKLEEDRRAFLATLDDDAIARPFSYRNMKGEPHTLPLIKQMQHVVNHSTLHRGQVVGMIRQHGIAPPSVDLIYYFLR